MSLAGRFGLIMGALVIVAAAWVINDRVFWVRWFSQPPGDTAAS